MTFLSPPYTNLASPKPKLNFLANMKAKRPWLSTESIAVLGSQHPLPKHPEKLLPKFDVDNDVTLEDHYQAIHAFS